MTFLKGEKSISSGIHTTYSKKAPGQFHLAPELSYHLLSSEGVGIDRTHRTTLVNSYDSGTDRIRVYLDFAMTGQNILKTKVFVPDTNSKLYKLQNSQNFVYGSRQKVKGGGAMVVASIQFTEGTAIRILSDCKTP